MRPGVLRPQRSRGVRELDLYHLVHLVEALHGLVVVVLAALQQVTHGHGATVVINVVAALAVGEAEGDLDRLGVDERGAAGQRNAEVAGEKASWENTARRAVRSRSWCCWFSACSPGSASTHPVLRL